ncbi:uncharacterized protein LOC117108152 [Anneissia japonica]|uniref:uncharacterized protein LOC117108152 n=1 Tax=Anneissia japonica TaxID=1529436 RepID=UPI0014258D47|nr:uncharacterized protein LOC117108152 [Anneissia japonica]
MNEIVKNAQSFIEVLQNSRAIDVKYWDSIGLQRALQWAKYCEEVYIKLKDKPKAVEQINKKLKLICCLPGASIGDDIISVQDLSQSQRLLLKNLIQNRYLPSCLFGEVLEQYTHLAEDSGSSGFDQVIQDASECIQAKSSQMYLHQNMRENFQMKEEHSDILNARLLKRFLVHHHSNSPCTQKSNEYLEQVLHSVASQPRGMRMIAMTISMPTETDEARLQVTACEQFVFDWIKKNKAKYILQQRE